jgi:pimeloyl-ACP methyl ester carboxylesterase
MSDLIVREYGTGLELVIALHGGPAAAGDVAPLARELGKQFHVLEPFQRGSGGQPLTVARHVQDLNDVIQERCGECRPVLVGHSWGAMLALTYAAAHPTGPTGLILIGCGAFSAAARREFAARLEARLTQADREHIAQVNHTEADENRRLAAVGRLMTRVYGFDIEEAADDCTAVDAVAYEETWADMVRLQRGGTYPAAFAAVGVPVLMVHGEQDPHPGRLTSQDLRAYIPHLEYRELPRCGHSPWLERQARRDFFDPVTAWLKMQCLSAVRVGTG